MTVVGGETMGGAFDASRIEAAVSELLAAIGEDVNRPGLQQTPARVAEAWRDFFAGVGADPLVHLSATSDLVDAGALAGELVLLRGIKFRSMCEHHLLPFLGTAHVGYVPRDRVVGLGKLPRVVDTLASRPQLQERLTEQIADALDSALDPLGVIVVLEASHGCVTARGVQQTESTTVTLATRGSLSEPAARAEAIALIGSDHG